MTKRVQVDGTHERAQWCIEIETYIDGDYCKDCPHGSEADCFYGLAEG